MSTGAEHDSSEVFRITTAGQSLSDDQRSRTKRYLVSMTIRTLCFIGAVLAPPPWRWILFVGALVLPYIAVVMANAGRDNSDRAGIEVFERTTRPQLEPGAGPHEQ
jgi:hypothetical protein